MAEKKIIELKVTTNVDKEAIKAQGLTNEINNVSKSVNKLNSAVNDTQKSGGILSSIKDVVGKFVPAFKGAEAGAISFGASLKALLANPIVLVLTGIAATLKFVYEAFQNTVVGAKAIERVWSGLSVVITNLKDGLFGLARALVYSIEAAVKFISLDFKGANEAMKKANSEASSSWNLLTKAIDGTTFAYEQNLKKREQVNAKFKKKLEVEEAEMNKLLLQSREILTDETASINEKKKALEEVIKYESDYSKKKLFAAIEDKKIAEERLSQAKKGTKTEKELKETLRLATIDLINAETENAAVGNRLNRQRKMLHRQEIADTKERNAAIKEANKAREEAEKENLKNAQEALKEDAKLRKKAAEDLAKELEDIEKKHNDRWKEITDKQNKKLTDDLQDVYDNQKGLLEAALIDDENNIQAKKDLLSVQMAMELENKELTEGEKLAIQKKYGKLIEQVDKDAADKRTQLEKDVVKAKMQIAYDSLNLISDITSLFGRRNEKEARRAFQIDKAAKLASATMAGVEGTIEAYKTAQKSPITAVLPAYPIIQAGLAAAFAATNIAKIASAQFNAGGGGAGGNLSPNAPSGASSGVNAPNLSFSMQGGGSSTAQLLNSVLGQPLKAYVVSSDITSAQMLDAKAIKTSVL